MKNFILIFVGIVSIMAFAEPPKLSSQEREAAKREVCSQKDNFKGRPTVYSNTVRRHKKSLYCSNS